MNLNQLYLNIVLINCISLIRAIYIGVPVKSDRFVPRHSSCFDRSSCRVGHLGACRPNQRYAILNASVDYFPVQEDLGLGCSWSLEDFNSSKDCLSPEYDPESLFQEYEPLAEYGICVWTGPKHPCRGFPASFRYFPTTGSCYQTQNPFDQNPCKERQQFVAINKKIGNCDCSSVIDIYWKDTDECYQIYTQGPCPEGRWLVLDKKQRPRCYRAKCLADGQHLFYPNPKTGRRKCYELGTRGPCEKGFNWERNYNDPWEINCVPQDVYRGIAIPAAKKNCSPGSKMAQRGNCKRVF